MTVRLRQQLLFLSLAICVNVAAMLAVRYFPSPKVQLGAILDMTLTVTGLYYWLVVRPGYRGKASLAFILLMGLVRASFAFPGVLPGRELVAGVAELAVLGAILLAWRKGRALAETDPVLRLEAILGSFFPSATAARALAAEFAVLYYVFAWRAKPHVPAGSQAFTLHKRSGFGDILLFVGLASMLEIGPVHLVVGHWSHMAAWIMTGLSLYGALWVVAVGRSLSLQPTLVSDDGILLRFGLLFRVAIPWSAIETVSTDALEGAKLIPRRAEANIYLKLKEPLRAERILGLGTQVQTLGICADEPEALLAAIKR